MEVKPLANIFLSEQGFHASPTRLYMLLKFLIGNDKQVTKSQNISLFSYQLINA